MKVLRNGVPGAVGKGRIALLPGLEVARVNGAAQIRQGLSGGAERELDGTGCLGSVGTGLEHWIEPLWVSVL